MEKNVYFIQIKITHEDTWMGSKWGNEDVSFKPFTDNDQTPLIKLFPKAKWAGDYIIRR